MGLLKELGATLTPVESSYVPGSTYCTIERGNPFALNAAALGYQPNFYYDTTAPGCGAIPWQTATPLVIASEGMLAACRKLSGESAARSNAVVTRSSIPAVAVWIGGWLILSSMTSTSVNVTPFSMRAVHCFVVAGRFREDSSSDAPDRSRGA